MALDLFYILVFPGFLFLNVLSLIFEFVDRKLYARLQNRVGPPWYQPLADILKLLSKETIIPRDADARLFTGIPMFALAATSVSFLYIPIWGAQSLFPFSGDLIVVMYFLTIPTLTFFLAGWFSSSVFAELGAIRAMTQLFAYEVPFYMALLGPAILAGTWSISGIAQFYAQNPLMMLLNLPGFVVSVFAAQGKLERVPFDAPDAETEIVGGTFTEYSGRLLAMFKMTLNIELVVVAALISAVFCPLFFSGSAVVGFLLFLVKMFVVIFLLTLMRAAMARFRLDQMVRFCWKILTPISIFQILLSLIAKGVFFS